ncbi:hypothetical protein L6164_036943 [Bauhinia variegata]|uniref:Uncharacterized protein n=1 Tax=Bauhinia variegata TaxID=167791 RepID=A0ACB9KIK1_BAUVA|nr:hypothetical protein L6164_036943 [Bauhinia variegata]
MAPESRLCAKSKTVRLAKLQNCVGIFPSKKLKLKLKVCSCDKLDTDGRIEPLKLLLQRLNCWSSSNSPIHCGNFPVKLLVHKLKTFNLCSKDNSLGKFPWKLLLWRSSSTRKDKFPKCGGIEPLRFMFGRVKAMTLSFETLQVTPNQLHTEEEADQLLAKIF